MKKVFLVLAVATALYACGGGSSESSTPVSNNEANSNSQIGGDTSSATTAPATADTAAAAQAPAADAPATAATSGKDGKALIEASDCRTCHQDAAKVIGPAYVDVAKKYPNTPANVKLLAGKIIAGGKGVWGEIPMTPHPNVSQEDAEAMVTYILSMKK
ncbi:MAG TPA: c-type cytochrome [Chitinophagaceae bacterium]|nr:c-type cytochrome [Chitinophagaceae bacterium]